jgi:hypothetical protein
MNRCVSEIHAKAKERPLLVKRCNGTTAGLGNLKESVDSSVSIGGNGTNSSADFNSSTQTRQYGSAQTHMQPPSKHKIKIMCPHQYRYRTSVCKIK